MPSQWNKHIGGRATANAQLPQRQTAVWKVATPGWQLDVKEGHGSEGQDTPGANLGMGR